MKMISKMGFALLALLLGSTGWGQTSFGKYGPVAGVQMNTGATPYNFAAGITDIQSLLSASPGVVLGGAAGGAKGVGSINATALFINGAAVGTSSGAVSSVALGSPGTCFGVTGSPVTSAGTLAYTLSGTTAQFIRGDGSCSNTLTAPGSGATLILGAVDNASTVIINDASATNGYSALTLENAGTVRGQIGLGTAVQVGAALGDVSVVANTGTIRLGNGASTFVSVGPSGNVVMGTPSSGTTLTATGVAGGAAGQFTGSGSGDEFFRFNNTAGDTRVTWSSAGTKYGIIQAFTNGFNFAANGASTALDLSVNNGIAVQIQPAGNVTVNAPSSGVAFSAIGIANQYAGLFTAGGSAGTQKGLSAVSTTQNAADKIFNVNNSVANLLDIFGDGHGDLGPNLSWTTAGNWSVNAPSSGIAVAATGAANSYAGQLTGSTTASQSFGLRIQAGTNASDAAIGIANSAATVTLGALFGDGHFQWGWNGTAATLSGTGAGNVIIPAPSSGQALAVSGVAGSYAVNFIGSSTTSQSFGLLINAGTNISDNSFIVQNRSGSVNYLTVHGDGSGGVGSTANALTWSAAGNVGINAPSGGGIAETVIGASSSFAAAFGGSSTASNSFGIAIQAGTNSSDANLLLQNAAQSVTFAKVFGDGGITAGSPTGGDKGLGSINAQAIYVNGVPLTSGATSTLVATGNIVGGSSGCTFTGSSGVTACSRSSAGIYSVTISGAFTATPGTCVTNIHAAAGATLPVYAEAAPTASSSTFILQTFTGATLANADNAGAVSFACWTY